MRIQKRSVALQSAAVLFGAIAAVIMCRVSVSAVGFAGFGGEFTPSALSAALVVSVFLSRFKYAAFIWLTAFLPAPRLLAAAVIAVKGASVAAVVCRVGFVGFLPIALQTAVTVAAYIYMAASLPATPFRGSVPRRYWRGLFVGTGVCLLTLVFDVCFVVL